MTRGRQLNPVSAFQSIRNPTFGFTGTTSFKNTAHDAQGPNRDVTGEVTPSVGPSVWFINNSAATNGNGSASSPFNFSAVNDGGAGSPHDHDIIHPRHGTA
jgi:hypothetical protein